MEPATLHDVDRELAVLDEDLFPSWARLGRIEMELADCLRGPVALDAVRARRLRVDELRRRWWGFDHPAGLRLCLAAHALATDNAARRTLCAPDLDEALPSFVEAIDDTGCIEAWDAWLAAAVAGSGPRVAIACAEGHPFAVQLTDWASQMDALVEDSPARLVALEDWTRADLGATWWERLVIEYVGRAGVTYDLRDPSWAVVRVPAMLGYVLERVARDGYVWLVPADAGLGAGDVLEAALIGRVQAVAD